MISDELLSKFDRIEDLPVSEEMLGAYMEGNLNDAEFVKISSIIDSDSNLSYISFGIVTEEFSAESELSSTEDDNYIASLVELPIIDENIGDFNPPDISHNIEIATLDDSQSFNDIFGIGTSGEDRVIDLSENILSFDDISDTDSHSLAINSDSEVDENLLNENLNF